MSLTKAFLIWSNEHRAWWRPDGNGYVITRSEAGRFDLRKAIEICLNANLFGECVDRYPNECIVPVDPVELVDPAKWELKATFGPGIKLD